MTIWRPSLKSNSGPRYMAIAAAIAESIADGSLRPDEQLPPQRELALALNVSLNTVSRAYAEATRLGLLDGEVGRGTFVRSATALSSESISGNPAKSTPGPIDFSLNLPFAGSATTELARTLETIRQWPQLASLLDHPLNADHGTQVGSFTRWIEREFLVPVKNREGVLCNGAQHGIFVALMALTRPGDGLLVEELTYSPIRSMARHLGLRVIPVAIDHEGILPDALEAACRSSQARTLYCLPTLQTPTTATMSENRRREIARVINTCELNTIEDDVFGFLPLNRLPPLAQYAPNHTIYLTSVSKCMAPGLRVGVLNAPAQFADALRSAVALSSWMPVPLSVEIANRWIQTGTAKRLGDEQRTEAIARQKLAKDILKPASFDANPSGFHLWLRLPDEWKPDAFRDAARLRGVEIQSASAFTVEPGGVPDAIRICLSHELNRDRVATGLGVLADLLGGMSFESSFVV